MSATQLHAAAQCLGKARALLRNPADALATDWQRNTPLHAAASGGQAEVTQLLLTAAPEAAVAGNYRGATPLHLAAERGHAAVAALLLQAVPAAAWARDSQGRLPIHCVRFDGREAAEMVRLLLQAAPGTVAEADWDGNLPLHVTAGAGDVGATLALLQAAPATAAAPNDFGDTPLHNAAYSGHAAILRQLLAAAADAAAAAAFNMRGHTPLHYAVMGTHEAAVQVLLEAAPAAVTAWNMDGEMPLTLAAWLPGPVQKRTHVLSLLLAAAPAGSAAAAAKGDWTPLHRAASLGNTEAVQLLLAAAPEAAFMRDAEGQLPLQRALTRQDGSLEAARCLLAAGGADLLLPILRNAGQHAQPLFADLAARLPLSAEQWRQVPAGCTDLGKALPAVLARSEQEAGWLVQRLPGADRQRLWAAALSLNRAQRVLGLLLPVQTVRDILSLLFDFKISPCCVGLKFVQAH